VKRVYRISLLLFFMLLLATSAGRIKYFLTEHDFLSNRPVPASEVVRQAHIRAEYDDRDRLVVKITVDATGKTLRREVFTYPDTSDEVRQKEVYDAGGTLKYRSIFGPEPQSLSYINYVFGLDSVKQWKDRFTTSELNAAGQPENYRFFDVDAFEYGGMEFDYDSSGRMTRQEWFRRPDNKSMHRYLYDYIPGTDITHIFEYDSNGVLVMDVKLSADGTEAILSFLEPEDSSIVNTAEVVFNLDGNLAWGQLSWIQTETADTQTITFDNSTLSKGTHSVGIPEGMVLRDSARYTILFDGMGTKGYRATSRQIRDVTYDISPPLMDLWVDRYIHEPVFTFSSTEPLDSAFLVWQADSLPADTISFEAEELAAQSEPVILNHQSPLLDGHWYRVQLFGYDQAGNLSSPGVVDSVYYDVTPALVTIDTPSTGDYLNHQVLSFRVNEAVQHWRVEWVWQGGVADDRAPYELDFSDTVDAETPEVTDLQTYFQPVDGGIYGIRIVITDLAGNVSEPTGVDSIHYDVSPPVLTMIFPYDGAAIKDPTVSYAVNEPLQAGEFLWTQTAGTPDSLSPQIVTLVGEELAPKEKIHITLVNAPRLADGAYYALTLTGRDRAGNDSEPVVVNQILFDASPPVFSRIEPDSGAALNSMELSYEISENLDKGSVLWVNTGGSPDPDAPHLAVLEGQELIGEFHDHIRLMNEPRLHDGSVYTLFFTGSDRAGNLADTVKIPDVLYDFTVPEIVIEYPQQRSISNSLAMDYTLSEDLDRATFKWIWLGGDPDSLAPYTVELAGDQLSQGRHEAVLLDSMPEFRENALYTLIVKGFDRAGNRSKPRMVPGLQYDFTPPVITWYKPEDDTAVNHKQVHYAVSELLAEGSITWVWAGGNPDPDSLHVVALSGAELYGQEHPLGNLISSPPLVDGAWYNILFSGVDPAGNQSNVISVNHIYYDITAPVIRTTAPNEYTYIASPVVQYELSETLYQGKITFTRTSGSADPDSPHIIEMDSTLKAAGVHGSALSKGGPELVEGAVYTITLEGRDQAGNRARTVQIQGVIYDATPPTLTVSYPEKNTAINRALVSYENSENLKQASMIWTRIGGTADPGSPHQITLTGDELKQGNFKDHAFNQSLNLVDGSVYRLTFFGSDFAGNSSDTVRVDSITYDVTPPVLAFISPTSDIFTTESDLLYSISEDLTQGRLVWEGTGPDGEQLLDVFDLTGPAAKAGEHHSDSFYIPDLQDGADYTITLEGEDAAGNKGTTARLTHYRIDRTPPAISGFTVTDRAFIRKLEFGWELSEDVASGSLLFHSLSGTEELTVPLEEQERQAGIRPPGILSSPLSLKDGMKYRIQMVVIDFAGNMSDTLTIDSVTYDISPPELTLIYPLDGAHIREKRVEYQTNELLVEARIVWKGVDETPVEVPLTGENLEVGKHQLLNTSLSLTENTPLEVFVTGMDRAGNVSSSDSVRKVIFDQTPPILAILGPASNSAVNHTRISYSTSETLSFASLQWEPLENDKHETPYSVELTGADLETGEHLDIEFSIPPDLKDGSRYAIRLTGKDLSGNEGQPATVENILYDITPPRFTDIAPVDSQYIREVNISYTLSEDLKSGQIIFENIGGTGDSQKRRVVNLVGKRKLKGPGGGLIPSSLVSLVNGGIYRIRFEGVDSAGNVTPETLINQVTFDNEPPVIALTAPTSHSFVNSTLISYSFSEDLDEAEIILEQIGGASVPKSPVTVSLSSSDRKIGVYTDRTIPGLETWVDGAVYRITIRGHDKAGNEAEPAIADGITYDITPPVITLNNPLSNSAVNYQALSYTLSEDLLEGVVSYSGITGGGEAMVSYDVELTGNELSAGKKDSIELTNGRPWINGNIYSMTLSGVDQAGNQGENATVENVLYDNVPPEASLSKPIDGEQIKDTKITYLLSEDLETGFAVFTQTGGTVDPSSPHKIPLDLQQRKQGLHTDVDLHLEELLADGGRYAVTIAGADRAGNAVTITPVQDILFDVRPPKLAFLGPPEGSVINQVLLSYQSSEEMLEGTITFTPTGGTADPHGPHTYKLSGEQLQQGDHRDVTLELPLQDGSIYAVTFEGMDLAGNRSDPVLLNQIRYDITPPTIQITSPVENSYNNQLILDYSLSEPFKFIDLTLERRGGTADPESPRILSLENEFLSAGEHSGLDLVERLHPVDGTTYILAMKGQDLAGNEAEVVEVMNVVYDISPPQLSLTAPEANGYYRVTVVSLSSSEDLSFGEIVWEWTGGSADPQAPHTSALSTTELTEGEHSEIELDLTTQLVSGGIYRVLFRGTDRAGNEQTVQVEPIYFDNSPTKVAGKYPANNAFINTPEVSYELNEPLTKGMVIWKPEDSAYREIRVRLADTELDSGTFEQAILKNQSDLQDGVLYKILFNSTDRAGNTAETLLADSVTYDISKPKFTRLFPTTGMRVNSPLIQWTVNEDLQSGSYTWIHMGGVEDPDAPHQVEFGADLLTKGDHDNSELPAPQLIVNAMYRITLTGTDRAGNTGKKFIMSIVFDDQPPELHILYPESNSQVNNVDIAYEITESLNSGQFTYTRTGGASDPSSPHVVELSGLELETVYKTPKTPNQPPVLQDGSVYSIDFEGVDLAGNASSAEKVENVRYDITKPVLSILKPVKDHYTIGSRVSFNLSENLKEGALIWSHSGGTSDSHPKHELELPADYLQKGTFDDVDLTFNYPLMAGGVYSLTIQGTDSAGNGNQPELVENVTYIRPMAGKWYFKGAIIEVVWVFDPDPDSDGSRGRFLQGLSLGTKISDQEKGRYQFNFDTTPWVLTLEMDNPEKSRISLFEFIDNTHMRVVTGTKKPKSWSDGEIMEYEYRP
jgi:hypothetical protein